MREPEDFARREEFEAPDPGFEPEAHPLRDEADIEYEDDVESIHVDNVDSENSDSKNNVAKAVFTDASHVTENSDTEKEMGLFKKSKDEDEYDDENAMEVMEEEEEQPKSKKAPKSRKSSGIGIKPILLFGVLALLVGGGYVAWEMLSTPATPVYQPIPKPKANIHPQEKKAAQAAPSPVAPVQDSLVVAEIAAKPQPNNPTNNQAEMVLVQAEQPVPMAQSNNPVSDRLNDDIREIRQQMTELAKMLAEIRGMKEAPQNDSLGLSREVVKEMTAEIQQLSMQNKALAEELNTAKKKIDEFQTAAKNKEKKARSEKNSEKNDKDNEVSQKSRPTGDTANWEILGFSGNRVIIADERGTHSVNIGQSLNGVKILAVDVESGSVKTSVGTLKYGQ